MTLEDAFLLLKNKREVLDFINDLCTPAEIRALEERWAIAQRLDEGQQAYREIAAELGASVTTVGRVARFLKDERYQGYRCVLDRLKAKN